MDLGIKDRIAIVTGGTKGIGIGIVRAFAAEGAIPVIVNRPGPEGHDLVRELESEGGRCLYIPAELAREEDCRKVVETTANEFGGIDILVNNAGYNDTVGLDRSPAEFMESVHNNLFHYFALAHFALPYLTKSTGTIVNIGSHVSITGQGGTSGYAAAKGAINALAREWGADLAEVGIRVNTVVPGSVWTNSYVKWAAKFPDPEARRRLAETKIPLGRRFTTVEEIASMVVFLASPRSGHTTGQIIVPDGGYSHLDRALTS